MDLVLFRILDILGVEAIIWMHMFFSRTRVWPFQQTFFLHMIKGWDHHPHKVDAPQAWLLPCHVLQSLFMNTIYNYISYWYSYQSYHSYPPEIQPISQVHINLPIFNRCFFVVQAAAVSTGLMEVDSLDSADGKMVSHRWKWSIIPMDDGIWLIE